MSLSRQILVLEDDPVIGETITKALIKDGHTAELKDSVSAAIAALAARRYDAVILDLALHDESGMTVLQDVAREFPQTAIVIVSATLSIASRRKCYENGARDFISKPFDPVELVLRVNRLLDNDASL